MIFTDEEMGVISNALRVASERFTENAKEFSIVVGMDRMTQQFIRQSTDARRLYERIAVETGVSN